MSLLAKVQQAQQLLGEIANSLSASDISSEASEKTTKLVSEAVRTNSEETFSDTKTTKKDRSQKQVEAYKRNFEHRWSDKPTCNASARSIYDDIC